MAQPKTKSVVQKVKVQVSSCTKVLLALAKKRGVKATLGKTPSGMDEITLVGVSNVQLLDLRREWAHATSITPTIKRRFEHGSKAMNEYKGHGGLMTHPTSDFILIAPSNDALCAILKELFPKFNPSFPFHSLTITRNHA